MSGYAYCICIGVFIQGHPKGLVMGSFWTGQRTDPAGCCTVHRKWTLTGRVCSQWLGTTQLRSHGGCWGVMQPLYRSGHTHAHTQLCVKRLVIRYMCMYTQWLDLLVLCMFISKVNPMYHDHKSMEHCKMFAYPYLYIV